MADNNKQIRSLIAGLISGNESKVEQITKELVESIVLSKKDLIVDALCEHVQRKPK